MCRSARRHAARQNWPTNKRVARVSPQPRAPHAPPQPALHAPPLTPPARLAQTERARNRRGPNIRCGHCQPLIPRVAHTGSRCGCAGHNHASQTDHTHVSHTHTRVTDGLHG
eukprot:356669-Chlamydomonas_euryale.AAC.3